MRIPILTLLIAGSLTLPAAAQNAAPMMKTFTSSAEVQELIAKAKADRKGNAPTTSEPILSLAPYHANLEYRPIAGPAAVHDTEDEVMYVIEGGGTITLGGQMVNPTRPNPTNKSADKISGGSDQKVAKGDFLIVPAWHAASGYRGRRSGAGADDLAYAAIGLGPPFVLFGPAHLASRGAGCSVSVGRQRSHARPFRR